MHGSSVWTAGELAEAVNLSRDHIEELLEGGDIRGHHVGGHWVVLKREALRWLRAYKPEEAASETEAVEAEVAETEAVEAEAAETEAVETESPAAEAPEGEEAAQEEAAEEEEAATE